MFPVHALPLSWRVKHCPVALSPPGMMSASEMLPFLGGGPRAWQAGEPAPFLGSPQLYSQSYFLMVFGPSPMCPGALHVSASAWSQGPHTSRTVPHFLCPIHVLRETFSYMIPHLPGRAGGELLSSSGPQNYAFLFLQALIYRLRMSCNRGHTRFQSQEMGSGSS